MSTNLAAIGYLVAAVCFILALRGLSSPATSRPGQPLRHGRHDHRHPGHAAGRCRTPSALAYLLILVAIGDRRRHRLHRWRSGSR